MQCTDIFGFRGSVEQMSCQLPRLAKIPTYLSKHNYFSDMLLLDGGEKHSCSPSPISRRLVTSTSVRKKEEIEEILFSSTVSRNARIALHNLVFVGKASA